METKNTKILLAEDDKNLGTILKEYLDAKGYMTKLCIDGEKAINTYNKEDFDLCIFDIMMPIKDGFILAKEIRKHNKKIPILFLTAKSLQEDIIKGLQLGADDYITKPFSMEELLLRINAVLRRVHHSEIFEKDTVFKIGNSIFDYNRQILTVNNKEQKLTSKETELLKLLCKNANEVLDRTIALNKIWNDDSYFNARSMDVYITKLRKYLKDDPKIELANIHGKGFKLLINHPLSTQT